MLVYLVFRMSYFTVLFCQSRKFYIDMGYTQTLGIYHRKIGDILVTAISDGFIDAPYGVLQNIV